MIAAEEIVSLEKVLAELEEPIKSRVNDIISEAIKKAKEIIESRKTMAKDKARRMVEEEIFRKRSLELGAIEKKKRTELLKAKYEVINEIKKMAEEKIMKIIRGENPQYDYYDILYNLIKRAIIDMEEDEIYIYANKRDTEFLKSKLKEIEQKISSELNRNVKLHIANENIECIGGIIVRNRSGNKVFYGTLDGRLKTVFERKINYINKELFKKYIRVKME